VKNNGEPLSKLKNDGQTSLAMLYQDKNQTENRRYRENSQLKILAPVRESIKMPEILGPRHDSYKESGKQNKRTTTYSTNPRDCI
jgi:hypothetical protein